MLLAARRDTLTGNVSPTVGLWTLKKRMDQRPTYTNMRGCDPLRSPLWHSQGSLLVRPAPTFHSLIRQRRLRRGWRGRRGSDSHPTTEPTTPVAMTSGNVPCSVRHTASSFDWAVTGPCRASSCYLSFFSLFCRRFSVGVRWAFFCCSLLPLSLLPLSPMSVFSMLENECSSPLCQIGLTFSALGPFGPRPSLNDTRCPSWSSS